MPGVTANKMANIISHLAYAEIMGRTRAGNASTNKQHGLLSVRSVLVLSGVEVRVRGGGKRRGWLWGNVEHGNRIKGEKLCWCL